jgi:hypothetical protein
VIAVSVVVEASGPGRIAIENVPMSFLVPHTGTPVETVTVSPAAKPVVG